MELQADPTSSDLTRLLGSADAEALSGLLTVQSQRGEALLYLKKGHLTLLAYDGRPPLMDALVSGEAIELKDLEEAREERRGSRRSLAEVLVEHGAIEDAQLRAIASARMLQDACEVLASASSHEFEDVKIPRNVFDSEERRLELAIAARELCAGVVQCAEKWQALREKLPSDNAYCVLAKEVEVDDAQAPDQAPGLAADLIERLDGTRSIAEVMSSFPTRRLEAYTLLADLVEGRNVRFAGPLELARLAEARMEDDPDRAWSLLSDGLAQRPRHRELLTVRARLAERRGDFAAATEALVGLAHIAEEAGETESARQFMHDAKRVAPDDCVVWERSFHLTLTEGREEAVSDGEYLAGLYRQRNRHEDALAVFTSLLENGHESWRVHRGLARSRVACGDVETALDELTTYSRESILRGESVNARLGYEELLDFDPGNTAARLALDELKHTRREDRRRKPHKWRIVSLACAASILAALTIREVSARSAFRAALQDIDEDHLVEQRLYTSAIERLEAVLEAHPLTPTTVDIRARIESLRK